MKPGEAMRLLSLAVGHHEAGRLAEAEAIYRRVLEAEPQNPHALHLLGMVAHRRGQHGEAIGLIEQAIAISPDNPSYWTNLGAVQRTLGRHHESLRAIETALGLAPGHVPALVSRADTLFDLGDHETALRAYERVLTLTPTDPGVWNSKGTVLKALGRTDSAIAAYRKALEIDPTFAEAHANLGLAQYAPPTAERAAGHLSKAVELQPGLGMAAFYLAVLREENDDPCEAERLFQVARQGLPDYPALRDSWEYVKANREPETRMTCDVFKTLAFALECARPDGLVLEFGVRFGTSIRHIAGLCPDAVHGFDSFEGLPEAWGDKPAGAYSTGGRLPDVPENVTLHAGWFADTLPGFLAGERGALRFANVDCDVYSSTRDIFDRLGERIVPGSVVVFDDYLMTDAWRSHEFKAFQEAQARFGWRYRYLAFSLVTRQAAVLITS